MSRAWTRMEPRCLLRSTWKEGLPSPLWQTCGYIHGAKTRVHNVCVISVQYLYLKTRSRDELPPTFRQIQFWSSHTSFSSWSFPTTRKEVKRIIRSRDNRRIRLKYLRGHLPHIWTFTSRAWIVKAWTNGRENRRLSMRNIFQFWCPGERERI